MCVLIPLKTFFSTPAGDVSSVAGDLSVYIVLLYSDFSVAGVSSDFSIAGNFSVAGVLVISVLLVFLVMLVF